jgi:DNA-binding SARP family transcriptional activator
VTRFEILSGVAARQGDWVADLSRQQQHLLVVLVMAGGAVVSRERLEEVLWDFRTPYPEHGVERVASELRRELRQASPEGDPVPACDGGYRLPVTREQADVLRFRSMCAEARRAHGAESLGLMRRALREWGPKAAGLHGGHPLCGLRGQWADSTRHALRTEYRDAVIHCLEHGMNDHDYKSVSGECQQRATDPQSLLDGEFVELWMRAAAQAGNPARAYEIYRRAEAAAARAGVQLGFSPPDLGASSRVDARHGALTPHPPAAVTTDETPAEEYEMFEDATAEPGTGQRIVLLGEPATSISGTVDVDEVDGGSAVAVDTNRAAGRIEGHVRAGNVGPSGEVIGVKIRQGS